MFSGILETFPFFYPVWKKWKINCPNLAGSKNNNKKKEYGEAHRSRLIHFSKANFACISMIDRKLINSTFLN